MKSKLVQINDHGKTYSVLYFICPGCAEDGGSGLHMLPVNTTETSPSWNWDGNVEKPTLHPSIKTTGGPEDNRYVCHSYLNEGVLQFLPDSTHSLQQKRVEIPDLPDWIADDEVST